MVITKEVQNRPVETIQITLKERTALSILFGLRQKFSRESNKDPQLYTSKEMWLVMSNVIEKLNRGEIEIYMRDQYIENDLKPEDPVWSVIDEAIKKSRIKRYRWGAFFKKSLTQVILVMKNKGHSIEETYEKIIKHEKIKRFIDQHPSEKIKMLENIRISINARYGESNTELKVAKEVREGKQ